ncbi:organic cation transporter protein-like [Ischnura elegans]|uniref:organic cation transporter protein-like n=1 Tax=Ischnura elegans TaxID=197161 RepID=UPI001ED8988E|nr:organic cation transporter protein-like [Ischnura elegans]XP_046399604.1 organic cation transporter protein-like [Ischnura elegans]
MESLEERLNAVTTKFGLWQTGVFLLVALVKIPSAWHMLGVLFKAPDAEFWCEQPKTLAHLPTEVWINISHPIKEERNGIKYYNPCEIYDVGFDGTVGNGHYQEFNVADYARNISYSTKLRPCREFRFDNNSVFQETVVTEWHLVCNRRILVNVSQFLYLVGILTGGFVATVTLPRVGPRCVLLFGAAVQIVIGTANAFVPLFELNITMRFAAAFGCAFMFTAGYTICRDITWGKSRIIACASYEFFWSFGVMSLPGLSLLFGTTSWRLLQISISVPTTVLLIFAYLFLPESPRWLMVSGRPEEAEMILKRIAQVNRQTIPEIPCEPQKPSEETVPPESKKPGKRSTWLIWFGLFEGPAFFKMVALHLLWITTIVTYYGALLNVKNLGSNLFLNIVIAGWAEIAGVIIGTLLILFAKVNKWKYLGAIMLTGGICCMSTWLLHLESVEGKLHLSDRYWWHQSALLILAMVDRIAIACSLTLLQVSAAEVVPADQQKMASVSTVTLARVFLCGAPFVGVLASYGAPMPLTAFGSLSIIGGISAFLLSTPKESPHFYSKNWSMAKFWPTNGKNSVWTVKSEATPEGKMECYNPSFIIE